MSFSDSIPKYLVKIDDNIYTYWRLDLLMHDLLTDFDGSDREFFKVNITYKVTYEKISELELRRLYKDSI